MYGCLLEEKRHRKTTTTTKTTPRVGSFVRTALHCYTLYRQQPVCIRWLYPTRISRLTSFVSRLYISASVWRNMENALARYRAARESAKHSYSSSLSGCRMHFVWPGGQREARYKLKRGAYTIRNIMCACIPRAQHKTKNQFE